MSEDGLPESGFRPTRIYFAEQSYKIVAVDEVELPEEGQRSLNFGWDWRYAEGVEEGSEIIEVRLQLRIGPTEQAHEELAVDLIGRFELYGDPSLAVHEFVMGPAPAILLPYLRHRLSVLSEAGPFGVYNLPIVNVQRLMADMSLEDTTGYQQEREAAEGAD